MTGESSAWHADVLDGFEARSVGSATLVRPIRQPAGARLAVLHVHGYNDYFFQRHLAEAITAAGYAFYAVDLSRAGRSLRAGDLPHYMADVAEQGDDLDAAIAAVSAESPEARVVVHAHSTGGLTATLWAHDRQPPALAGLVLDSPLFGLKASRNVRWWGVIALALLRWFPLTVVATAPSHYSARLHVSGGGAWDFDRTWKRPQGVPVRAGWLRAARAGMTRVAAGLDISVPVLVARSASSGPDSPTNPQLLHQDTVVDVAAIARVAPRLGTHVDELVIDGGVHDLLLSDEPQRTRYLGAVTAWLDSL